MINEVEWIERIAVMEHQVNELRDSTKVLGEKLDELLSLRSKGVGAFWLASSLVGTGVIGLFAMLLEWIKHG